MMYITFARGPIWGVPVEGGCYMGVPVYRGGVYRGGVYRGLYRQGIQRVAYIPYMYKILGPL
jgi:hypothetical protein